MWQNWSVRIVLVAIALAAPWLGTVDPTLFDAASRDLLPGEAGEITTLEGDTLKHRFLMGSDSFGRDIYSRVLYGTRVSLIVGLAAALVALTFGVLCGLSAGYIRWLDGPLMRVMDGIMAIPAILIAIAVVALWRASLPSVVIAIAIPEIPRVTRLVRSLVLTIREEPYVEAAVSLGTPTASLDDIRIAARGAQLEALIDALPDGLATRVGERGMQLSGGERQRVGIARALLRRPGLYVLDEPTSMLDSRTERAIQDALHALPSDATTIVIAHRLSTIAHADEIVVLDEGRIRERGSHRSLLAMNGLYAQMWRHQMADAS